MNAMTNENQLLREALEKIDLCLSQCNQYQARVEVRRALMSAALTHPAQPADGGEAASPFRAALMGHGRVAIGHCKDQKSGTPGVIYLDMGDEQRPIGADTSDLFTPGSVADESKVLACIYFANPDAVMQSITVLRELLADQFGVAAPPASQEQLTNGLTEAETSATASVMGLTASQEQAQQPSGQAWANETGLRQIECPSCGDLAVAYDPQQPSGGEVVAYKVNWPGVDSVGMRRFYGADEWEASRGTVEFFGGVAIPLTLATPKPEPMTDEVKEKALDLLATMFDAYENGVPCHEDNDGGYIGMAFKLDDETFHACADVLNGHRPKAHHGITKEQA